MPSQVRHISAVQAGVGAIAALAVAVVIAVAAFALPGVTAEKAVASTDAANSTVASQISAQQAPAVVVPEGASVTNEMAQRIAEVITTAHDATVKENFTLSGNEELDNALLAIVTAHPTLESCYRYIIDNFGYREVGYEPDGAWEQEWALDFLRNGSGNCYEYSALFCWLASALGYEANTCQGYVAMRGGFYSIHCWAEVHVDGTTYVCDPELQQAFPAIDLFMKTYDESPVTYIFRDLTGEDGTTIEEGDIVSKNATAGARASESRTNSAGNSEYEFDYNYDLYLNYNR